MNCLGIKILGSGVLTKFFFLGMANLLYGQSNQINWISWEQMEIQMKNQKKKVVVDVYTNWCTWCKRMESTTFRDPNVVKAINKNYYAVKFNAEQREDINFRDRVFKYVSKGTRGYHELAAEITQGQLSYPTIVFMDENLNTIQPLSGYLDAPTFEMISNYFGGNYNKNTPFRTFQENYKMIKDH